MEYRIHYSTNESMDPDHIQRDVEEYVRSQKNPNYQDIVAHIVRKYKRIPEDIGVKKTMSIPTKCDICHKKANELFVMCCDHVYHEKCLLNWFTYGTTDNTLDCPMCRESINDET